MRRLWGVMAVAAVALVAGCGGESGATEEEFSPAIAEEYVTLEARADVMSNPKLVVQNLESPSVDCRERPEKPDTPPGAALFNCKVKVVDKKDKQVARQTWEVLVAQDQTTRETIVREARRLRSTIPKAPLP